MFGKKKNIAPQKNRPKAEQPAEEKKSFGRKFRFSFGKGEKSEKKKHSRFRLLRSIASLLDGSFLQSDFVMRNWGLTLFVFVWILIAIMNNYSAQRKIRHIDKLKNEIKDLRDDYISTKSQLMYSTKMSEVARRLQNRGIQEPLKPPFKLFIKTKEDSND
jgi:hypothetical protein